MSSEQALDQIRAWFTAQGWRPAPFQEEAWAAYLSGRSGLLHVPTGSGKTLAAFCGPLAELISALPRAATEAVTVAEVGATGVSDTRKKKSKSRVSVFSGVQVLYVTPLKAVSHDVEKSLLKPIQDLELPLTLESRTGDTSSHRKARQKQKPPQILITTPESLSLLLSYPEAPALFGQLKSVIVDEWHELLSTKRGTQTELALARLRKFSPGLRTWALSATIKNLGEAAQAVCGKGVVPHVVSQEIPRPIVIKTVSPVGEKAENMAEKATFPWAGHMGLAQLKPVVDVIDINHSTLLFTNTRSQAEKWFQALVSEKPEWASVMALHHGSVGREERAQIEAGLKEGSVKLCVATSSLDLGVDFSPVEVVFQVGSPKGVARLMQRAGRSAHRPGAPCVIHFVPTHALEFIEIAAVRKALADKEIDERNFLRCPLDVLVQHLVTCALSTGFTRDEMLAEIRMTLAYENIVEADFAWALKLVEFGGDSLRAYPQYHKVICLDGRYQVIDATVAKWHRLNIGTIASDSAVDVIFLKGRRLGQIEESFIAKLKKHDQFAFAGRIVEFVRMNDNKAYVRLGKKKKALLIPQWQGGRLPFSPSLSAYVKKELTLAKIDEYDSVEMKIIKPILQTQKRLSQIPSDDECLIEHLESREGHHLFIYPFEGRMVHEGLAAVLSLRLARQFRGTFSIAANDYGFELMCASGFPFDELLKPSLFVTDGVVADILESLNLSELARRQFREIARVAGLVIQNVPRARKTARQIQSSSGLIYDVFKRYEPQNLLLRQAQDEVLFRQFEETRLAHTMNRIAAQKWLYGKIKMATPLSLPLILERQGATISNESMAERVKRMRDQWATAP